MHKILPGKRLKILTWHIHGTYLYYLSQGNYDIYIPVNDAKDEGYYGRGKTFPFKENVIEVPADKVKDYSFDCILFQTNKNYLIDQYVILTEEQRMLPAIYLEHDPPTKNPTEQKHIMHDANVLMVHVSHFNKLMWHNENCQVKVIDHGVVKPSATYTGEIEKGIVVINHLHQRGRKLGADIFNEVKKHVPLDLIGMGTKEYGGLGEILHPQIPSFISRYRFFFNPIRYTSLGLAVCEAMMTGIPIVALATTEYVTVLKNNVSGIIDTNVDYLIKKMKELLNNKDFATSVGNEGKKIAGQRFNIERFTSEWEDAFRTAIQLKEMNYEKKENSIY